MLFQEIGYTTYINSENKLEIKKAKSKFFKNLILSFYIISNYSSAKICVAFTARFQPL